MTVVATITAVEKVSPNLRKDRPDHSEPIETTGLP